MMYSNRHRKTLKILLVYCVGIDPIHTLNRIPSRNEIPGMIIILTQNFKISSGCLNPSFYFFFNVLNIAVAYI